MIEKYPVHIFWSNEDDCYVALVDGLEGCIAHGDTHCEALNNLEEAYDGWMEVAEEIGTPIHPPTSLQDIADLEQAKIKELLNSLVPVIYNRALAEVEKKYEQTVQKAARQVTQEYGEHLTQVLSSQARQTGQATLEESLEFCRHGRRNIVWEYQAQSSKPSKRRS